MSHYESQTYPFTLPGLGYAYDALEPHFDARTMEIHHTKHHAAYVNNLNAALEKHPQFHDRSLPDILRNLSTLPADIQTAVRNNGGGHLNHSFFWKLLRPGGRTEPAGEILRVIQSQFESLEAFKGKFHQAAMTRFGSGWAWLVRGAGGKLQVLSTANQDPPVLDGFTPLVGLDVWEHAYYLKFQNRRAEYVETFWKVLNWDVVEQAFQSNGI